MKKLIIIALIATCASAEASEKKRFNPKKLMPAFWLFGVDPDRPVIEQATLGVATNNIAQASSNVKDMLNKALDPKLMGETSHAAGQGLTSGAVEGTFKPLVDGVKAHPWLTAGAVTAGALWYMIPSQEDNTRRARLKSEEELHKATEERNKILKLQAQQELDEIKHCTELRTCMNTHFGRDKTRQQRVPSPCNSPARRLSSYNAAKAESIINGFNKYV